MFSEWQAYIHHITKAKDALEKLQAASDTFQNLLEANMEAANQSAILNALSFDQMSERFFQVPEAAKKTFTWILEDSDAQMSSNSDLKFPFKDWLASSSGIFYISGKPGSGKSTLMKYLCKRPETTSLL
jgi:polynucleotide 5'-kinase involved in rRNA processing